MILQKSAKLSLAASTSFDGGFDVTFVADIRALRRYASAALAIAIN